MKVTQAAKIIKKLVAISDEIMHLHNRMMKAKSDYHAFMAASEALPLYKRHKTMTDDLKEFFLASSEMDVRSALAGFFIESGRFPSSQDDIDDAYEMLIAAIKNPHEVVSDFQEVFDKYRPNP